MLYIQIVQMHRMKHGSPRNGNKLKYWKPIHREYVNNFSFMNALLTKDTDKVLRDLFKKALEKASPEGMNEFLLQGRFEKRFRNLYPTGGGGFKFNPEDFERAVRGKKVKHQF